MTAAARGPPISEALIVAVSGDFCGRNRNHLTESIVPVKLSAIQLGW